MIAAARNMQHRGCRKWLRKSLLFTLLGLVLLTLAPTDDRRRTTAKR
jgi:hypothetical protein